MTDNSQMSAVIDRISEGLIKRATDILRYPSKQGAEAGAQRYVERTARQLGADVIDLWEPDYAELSRHPAFVSDRNDFRGSPNLAAVWKGNGGGRSLILSSHIDVVPEGDHDEWHHGPFSGEVVDGVIYGRGVSDMKGSLAAMFGAIEGLRLLGLKLMGDLTIISTIEEETGGSGALSAVLRGYRAEAAIVPEPTGFDLCPAQQGGARFLIKVQGKSAHAGQRLMGVSALDKTDLVRKALTAYERYLNERFRSNYYEGVELPFSVNVGYLKGGDWFCSVPETAVLEGRLAVPPGLTVEESLKLLKEFIGRETESDPWLKEHPPEVSFGQTYWQPAQIDPDSPIVQTAGQSFRDHFGRPPVIRGTAWGTDGRMFTEFGSTPALVFGPGTSAHCPNEFLKVRDLIDYTKILINLVARWCGTTGGPDSE
jgi:acetylornithine deacetylase